MGRIKAGIGFLLVLLATSTVLQSTVIAQTSSGTASAEGDVPCIVKTDSGLLMV